MKRIRKNLRVIKRATKWSNIKIIKKLMMAKMYGITMTPYIKNRCYNMTIKELKKLSKTLKYKKNALNKTIKKQKLSKKEGKERLNVAQSYGITYKMYTLGKMWNFSLDELVEYGEALNKKHKKTKEDKEWYIKVAMDKTGQSKDEVLEKLNIARERGYSTVNFMLNGLEKLTVEEIKVYPKPVFKKKNVKQIKKENKEYEQKIRKEMNWSEPRFKIEFLKSRAISQAKLNDYYQLMLYKYDMDKQKEFMTNEVCLKMSIKYCDYGGNYKFFDSKALFNEKFKNYLHRKWFIASDFEDYYDFKEKISNLNKIIVKPLYDYGGSGINIYKVNRNIFSDYFTYKKIKNKDYIIEEVIEQDENIGKIYPGSLNTIRIMTIIRNGKFEIIMAALRMGCNKTKTIDNFTAGGLVASINPKTGIVITDAVDKKGNIYELHPDTNTKIKGFQIPKWNEIIKKLKDASKEVPKMPYIGWDIAITKNGEIELIEGNHNPGIRIFQYPYAVIENKGVRPLVEKYLNDK